MHDVITFIFKYMEMFLGLIFICIIIVVQLISLSKIPKPVYSSPWQLLCGNI